MGSSENYIWDWLEDKLGSGSFGVVYKGMHNRTGELVAVKVLKAQSSTHIKQQLQKEVEILKNLDHPNIIKLIAVEEQKSNAGNAGFVQYEPWNVIIMEFVNGGSIYDELQRNGRGLSEAETLTIIAHISAALRYLRDHQLIHRDIKPSNILIKKFIMFRNQYKLCDFGTARVLAGNEFSQTLVGTPAYVHPKILEAYLKGGCGGECRFPATYELWSVGVTIYHIATGQLPFHYQGGIEALVKMISKKPKGVISGVQMADGRIEWSKKLPDNSRLSSGLRPEVEGLLAALLDTSDEYSFDDFFRDADRVSSLLDNDSDESWDG